MNLLLSSFTLVHREITHFYRDRARLIGVLLQPLLFWLLIGTGLNASFQPAGNENSYIEYFFPGILLMVIMFTAIFSTFSIIEDRRAGFMQGVLVSPAPRAAVVLGKVVGGALLGMLQGSLFLLLLLLPMLSLSLTFGGLLQMLLWMLITGFLLTTLGVLMAWPMSSTHGYHSLMSVLLLPMWIFSGAAFPMTGAPMWLRLIMQINPLSHALALMRGSLAGHSAPPHAAMSILFLLVCLTGAFIAALWLVRRR